jgi:hypothetical protein
MSTRGKRVEQLPNMNRHADQIAATGQWFENKVSHWSAWPHRRTTCASCFLEFLLFVIIVSHKMREYFIILYKLIYAVVSIDLKILWYFYSSLF